MNLNYYWNNKENRARIAYQHTNAIEKKYPEYIAQSVANTIWYKDAISFTPEKCEDMTILLRPLDSVAAIEEQAQLGQKMAVLNFSSYKNPGGQFLNGSRAQEESLCHASTLYNVLSRNQYFYDYNKKDLNRALYRDAALYTPDIIFECSSGRSIKCDVITCAAPNFTAASKYCKVSSTENITVLRSRIRYVLQVAAANHINILILGAYGCGVFGQNPYEVAAIFNELLLNEFFCFNKVIFAVPAETVHPQNYNAFKSIFLSEDV